MTSDKKSDRLIGLRVLKEILPPDSPSSPRTIHGRDFSHQKGIKNSESLQKLEHFADCMHEGILPDGKVMIWMADAIREYLDGSKKTIDSAFSLRAKPRKGNAADHYREDRELFEKIFTMFLYIEDEKISQPDAAYKTLRLFNEHTDGVDAFLQKYKRYIKDKNKFRQMIRSYRKERPVNSDK